MKKTIKTTALDLFFDRPVYCSVATKSNGPLTKIMRLDPDTGMVVKDGSECWMAEGTLKTESFKSYKQFANGLRRLKPNQCLVHGTSAYDLADVTTIGKLAQVKKNRPADALPIIARSKEHIKYPDGPALMMFDHDKARDNSIAENDSAPKSYRTAELMKLLSTIMPEIANAGYVSTPSTSACISDKDGNELRGEGSGSHIYIIVENGRDIPRFLKVLGKWLLLAGYGRVEISRAGTLLFRTLIDLLVGSPERLDFAAGAICKDGLVQKLPVPIIHDGNHLNTALLLDLSPDEELDYNATIERLTELARPSQAIIQEQYVDQETLKLSAEKNISIDAAKQIVLSRQNRVLTDNDLLYFSHLNGKAVTVADVLNAPASYDKKPLADPLEPEYNGSMTTAMFYWNNGKPSIHSFAHGKYTYHFKKFESQYRGNNGANSPFPQKTIDELNNMNKEFASCLLGGKYRIIKESYDHSQGQHTIDFMEFTSFKNFFSNKKVLIQDGDSTKAVSIAKVWQQWEGRRTYDNVVFFPGNNAPKHSYNLFRGFPLKPKKGDWSLMEDHLRTIICAGDSDLYDYLISWMARTVQDPGGKKPGVAIVMKGGKGVGKGVFANYFGKIFGEAFLPISTSKGFTGNFNAHLSKCLMVFLDEAVWGGDKPAEGQLKALITEPTMLFEAKGIDSMALQSFINVIMASNEDWVCPATVDERRFCVLSPSSARQGDTAYFDNLCDQMDNGGVEAMYHDLLQQPYDMSTLRKAPHTVGLIEQVTQSLPSVLQFWHFALSRGFLLSHRDTGTPVKAYGGNASDDWPDKAWKYEVYNEYRNNFCKGERNIKSDKAFWTETWKFWVNGKAGQTRPQFPGSSRKYLLEIDTCESMQDAFTKYTGIQF